MTASRFLSLLRPASRPFRRTAGVVLAIGLAAMLTTAHAAAQPSAGKGSQTGLPLPRFASLRASEVNLRTGPGSRYPVEWVLVYRHMPVEIIAEFDTWRKVRDWEGTIGWVHQSMLSGRRWVIVRDGRQPLRRAAQQDAPVVARIEKKVIGRLTKCREIWCEIDFSGFSGWMRRDQVWGVYAHEKLD